MIFSRISYVSIFLAIPAQIRRHSTAFFAIVPFIAWVRTAEEASVIRKWALKIARNVLDPIAGRIMQPFAGKWEKFWNLSGKSNRMGNEFETFFSRLRDCDKK